MVPCMVQTCRGRARVPRSDVGIVWQPQGVSKASDPLRCFQGSGAVSSAVRFSRHAVDLRACCYDTDAQTPRECYWVSQLGPLTVRMGFRGSRVQIPPSRLDENQSYLRCPRSGLLFAPTPL